MEICTYIVEGSLTHKDSMGTKETIGRGGVQFMVRKLCSKLSQTPRLPMVSFCSRERHVEINYQWPRIHRRAGARGRRPAAALRTASTTSTRPGRCDSCRRCPRPAEMET